MPSRGNTGTSARDGSYSSLGGTPASGAQSGSGSGYAGAAGAGAASSRHSEIIVYVRRKDDAQQIIGYVLEERSVILNCESIDDAQCQRVIDMLGGAAYAIGGHVQRVSHRNYLFAPANVEVSSSDSQPVSRYQAAAAAQS
jgi:cell division inhibitor SepF